MFEVVCSPGVLLGPQVFREDCIISGYRHPQSSALDCILSSFQMNNETLNIWTHFLPTWCVRTPGSFSITVEFTLRLNHILNARSPAQNLF